MIENPASSSSNSVFFPSSADNNLQSAAYWADYYWVFTFKYVTWGDSVIYRVHHIEPTITEPSSSNMSHSASSIYDSFWIKYICDCKLFHDVSFIWQSDTWLELRALLLIYLRCTKDVHSIRMTGTSWPMPTSKLLPTIFS